MNQRTNVLAERPEQGTLALASFASTLTEEEWQKRIPKDGRKVGVIVHHAATVYHLSSIWPTPLLPGELCRAFPARQGSNQVRAVGDGLSEVITM